MAQSLEPIPVSQDDLLHQVFDQSTAGFQVIDSNWRYLFVNETVAKQGKSEVQRLVGHTMMEMYPGIDKTPLFGYLKKCMDQKTSIRMDNEFIYPDGTRGWFQLFIHSWSDGIMIFSIDITDRKLAEAEMSEKIEELEKSAKSSEDKKGISELKATLLKIRKPQIEVI